MEITSIMSHPMMPCVLLGIIFGATGHYFETKPYVIILGIVALFVVHLISNSPNDKMLESDLGLLREENDNLKRNLMQVYQMVQQQKQNAPPPAPIPPGMTSMVPPDRKIEEEDDEAKPYL